MRKRLKLRQNEYYNVQDTLDELYSESQQGKHFKNLIQIMQTESNIRLAYRKIKRNKGSKTPGVDGLTIKDIEKLQADEVIAKIRTMFERYCPKPVRRKMIRKPNGKFRPLGIPCIWDRLFQQCILQVLEPICEAKFHSQSYGFRPNRGTKHAIARFNHLVNHNELYHCVEIDIKGFFDNVNHGKLIKQMWSIGIRDKKLLSIVSTLIKAEIAGEGVPTKGTPQGGILSPLLSNIVLNELDWWISNQWETFNTKKHFKNIDSKRKSLKQTNLKEMYIVRYADDFKILCRTRNQAIRTKAAVESFLGDRLRLECSPDKSKITNLTNQHSEFLGFTLKAIQKGIKEKKTIGQKYLGRDENGKRKYEYTTKAVVRKPKYVCVSHMSEKSISNAKKKISEAIEKVHQHPSGKTVLNYNATVMGIQNYYKVATRITEDLSKLSFHCQRTFYNQLKNFIEKANRNKMSKGQKARYGELKTKFLYAVDDVVFAPIYAQKHQSAMNFSQDICNYTQKGRNKIHDKLMAVAPQTLVALSEQHIPGRSIEYHDNRISKFIAQYGKCYVTGKELGLTGWHCHHKIPYHKSKDDRFINLVILVDDVHKLIHMTDPVKISKTIELLELGANAIRKVNELRKLANFDGIPDTLFKSTKAA